MVITAGIHILKFPRFVVMPLRVFSLKKKTLDLVCGIERVAFLLVQCRGVSFQHAPNIRAIGRAVLVDHFAEHQHLAGPKNIRRPPVKRAPIHRQPQIALALRRKPANRGPVKRQVVPALDQKLFVIIQHVQAAFEVAKEHRHGLDPLLVCQVLDPLFLNFVRGNAVLALLFGFQVQLFEFVIGKSKEITQFVRHESPQNEME